MAEVTMFESNPAEAVELLQQQYTWLPTPELERKALKTFTRNAPKIRAALGSSSLFATMYEIDTYTLNALLEDYARALLGVFVPVATPAQIATLKPLLQDTFDIDRWGLGLAVIDTYWTISQGLEEYAEAIKTKEGAARYLNGAPEGAPSYLPTIRALTTIYQTEHAGLFDYDLFRDAAGEDALENFITHSLPLADLYAYTLYFGICEHTLGGEKVPKIPRRIKAIRNLEDITRQRTASIEEELNAVNLNAATEQEEPPATLRVSLRKVEEKPQPTGKVNLPSRIMKVLGSPLEYTENTDKKRKERGVAVDNIVEVQTPGDLLPILNLVEDGLERKPSELRIAQALGGVNYLFSQQRPREVNGLYTISTSLNELADASGVVGSWEDKQQLVTALQAIDKTYLALVEDRKTIAVKILSLRKVEQEQKGSASDRTFSKLTIDLTKEAVDNGSQSLLYADYNRYRREFDGAAGYRFLHQILSKSHISEEDLIDQVFGNKTKVKEAELGLRKAKSKAAQTDRTPAEEAALVRRTLQQNRPHQRKQLAAMFEKAKEKGLIYSYSRTKRKGWKGYVYSWNRKQPAEALGLA